MGSQTENSAPSVPAWLVTALTVKSTSTVPPYEQVRTGLLDLIHRSRLPVGSKLPTVRALAAALGVSANTVARAYKELEQAAVVTARPRLGTVVAQGADSAESQLAAAAAAYAEVARTLGYGRREAVRHLEAVFPA
ncbi:GntR family transcriptional regulator [Citricoccus sp. NPDC055426]|uniref:GntR family transcriptional regulator n=1 Tax=Citricoccus sp. NPDC055426 TaxID=3155536 RepID=UPI003424A190